MQPQEHKTRDEVISEIVNGKPQPATNVWDTLQVVAFWGFLAWLVYLIWGK